MAETKADWAYPEDWDKGFGKVKRAGDEVGSTFELVDEDHFHTAKLERLQDKYTVSGILKSWGGQYPSKVAPARMEGFRLWTPEGQEILDLHGDILSMSLGWAHPRIKYAVNSAREMYPGVTMIDTTRLSEPALLLAKDMVEGMKQYGDFRALFASTGTSANNQAIRLCMGALGGPENTQLIVFEGGYGGADLEMNGHCEVPGWKGVTSLIQNALVLKRDGSNFAEIEAALKASGKKPLFHGEDGQQGVAGFHVIDKDVMRYMAEMVHDRGGLFIADDVQDFVRNGAGLIGVDRWAEKGNAKHMPDAVTFAKGLGNGRPVAAVLVKEEVLEAVKASGKPGSTFDTFSQPTDGLIAARQVWAMSREQELWRNVQLRGELFKKHLRNLAYWHPGVIQEVIGEGGLIAVRLDTAARVVSAFENGPKNGIEFGKGGLKGDILRLALPFNATNALVNEACNRIEGVMKAIDTP